MGGQAIAENITGKKVKSKNNKLERKSYYIERKESAFVCEVGYGKGTSISINGVGISRYTDITHGVRNADKYSKISGIEYQIGVGVINYSSSYEMEYPFPKGFSYYEYDSLNAKNMLRSPFVVKSRDLSFLYKSYSVSTNSNDKTLFMGLDVDFHLGLGGHFKCGWDSGVPVYNPLLIV